MTFRSDVPPMAYRNQRFDSFLVYELLHLRTGTPYLASTNIKHLNNGIASLTQRIIDYCEHALSCRTRSANTKKGPRKTEGRENLLRKHCR
jgi:hypothetical protein